MPEALPQKRERYFTVAGSGTLEDYTAIALFEGKDNKRDAVIGIKLKNHPEVSGFIAFIAEKFGTEHRYKPAMLELPMIYWKGGILEEEVLVMQSINQWIDHDEDPCECFYETLEEVGFESFFSDYLDFVKNPRSISQTQIRTARKKGKGFG